MGVSPAVASMIAWMLLPYGLAAWLAWRWMADQAQIPSRAGPAPIDDPTWIAALDANEAGSGSTIDFHGPAAWFLLTSMVAWVIVWLGKTTVMVANQILFLQLVFTNVVISAGWGGPAGGNGMTVGHTLRNLAGSLGESLLLVLPALLALWSLRALDHEPLRARFPTRLRHAPFFLLVLGMAAGLSALVYQVMHLWSTAGSLLNHLLLLSGVGNPAPEFSVAYSQWWLLADLVVQSMAILLALIFSALLLMKGLPDSLRSKQGERDNWLALTLILALAGYLSRGIMLLLAPVRVAAFWPLAGTEAVTSLEGGIWPVQPILSLTVGAVLALWVIGPTRQLIERLGWHQELATWERAGLLLALAAFMSWPASLLVAIFEASRTDPSDEVLVVLPYVLGAAAIAVVVWMLFVFKPVVADEDAIG